MNSCIFCKIINKEIKSEFIYENENFVVFKDINPQSPIHLLIVPKIHIENINSVKEEDLDILKNMFLIAKEIAQQLGVAESGYRIVVNTNKDAGQEVFHIHFHFLAGRKFQWPPG